MALRTKRLCRTLSILATLPHSEKPRSGESLPAPGFSRGERYPNARERRRRDSRSRLETLVGSGALARSDSQFHGFRAYGAFARFVFEFPRLKPGAGRMPPLRG